MAPDNNISDDEPAPASAGSLVLTVAAAKEAFGDTSQVIFDYLDWLLEVENWYADWDDIPMTLEFAIAALANPLLGGIPAATNLPGTTWLDGALLQWWDHGGAPPFPAGTPQTIQERFYARVPSGFNLPASEVFELFCRERALSQARTRRQATYVRRHRIGRPAR